MPVVGVICEYNPFHLGHEKQLRMIRQRLGEDTSVVCVMSGNYVQRGQPAAFDKMTRAEAALRAGADLVLELPVTRVLQSAEGFASGGVEILDRLGLADHLCFGCECGDGEALMGTAQLLETAEYAELLRQQLALGESYPAARQLALSRLGGADSLLQSPNDILAVEYCRALLRRNSSIRPMALLRQGDYHDRNADAENPSAASLRELLQEGKNWLEYVPEPARPVFASAPRYAMEFGERAVLARLRGMSGEQWQKVPHGGEGLWSRVQGAVMTSGSVEEILTKSKSKRYPRTRLQRLLMCAYLGLTQEDLDRELSYVRVLGFDGAGAALLRKARNQGSLAVINAGERPQDADSYEAECRAARLYGLFAEKPEAICRTEESRFRVCVIKK